MKLQSVHLENFRCFENITIDFHKQLTVLVGANGSGKSTILDAIAPELATIASAFIEKLHFYYDHPTPFTTNDSHHKNKEILPNFNFNIILNQNYPTIPTRHDVSFRLNAKGTLEHTHASRGLYNEIVKNVIPRAINTIFSYYPAKRLLPKEDQNKVTSTTSLSNAYENMLDQYININASLAWFDSKDAEQARMQVLQKNFDFVLPDLQAVKDAITRTLQSYTNPHMMGTPPELMLCEKNNPQHTMSFAQLSDGYRMMLALVMDIARRMAVANGENCNQEGKSVLDSPAIILIDEVDLHLHPSWQQRVLTDLMRTFPNAQFIVTTHSPQVLSAVKPEHIRILHDNKVLKPSHGTFGAESSRILFDVFGVQTRLTSLFMGAGEEDYPLEDSIEKYFTYIAEDNYDSAEAIELRKELESILHDDPLLARADAQIERARRLKSRRERHA